MMKCGVCEEIKRRKAAGYPKRMISSVANWYVKIYKHNNQKQSI